LLLQLSTAAVTHPSYEKLPGILFDADAEDVKVESQTGCKNICDDRGKRCQSYSYQQVTKECKVTPRGMAFDPGSVVSIKKDQGGYFQIPGLSFFHEDSGEWLPTSTTTDTDCADLCSKRKMCHLYKFEKAKRRCSLSGKPIVFDPHWSYYSKLDAPSGSSPSKKAAEPEQAQEAELQHQQGEVKQLATEIQQENQLLVKEKAEVVSAKAEAAAKLKQEAAGDATLTAMEERLRAAKKSAEQMVVDSMDEKSLDSAAKKLDAKTELEKAKMAKHKKLADWRLAEDMKAAKADEAKKLGEVARHVKNVEHAEKMQSLKRSLNTNMTLAKDEARQEAALARDADRQLRDLRIRIKKQEKDSGNEISAKKTEMEKSVHEAAAEATAREHAIAAMNRAAIQRAIEMQEAKEGGATKAELANLTATQKNLAEQWRYNMSMIKGSLKATDKEMERDQKQKEKFTEKIAQERRDLDRVHTKTRSIYAGILAAKEANDPAEATHTQVDPKITAMIEKAQREAADAEHKAKMKAETDAKEVAAKAEKEKVKTDEIAAKAGERVTKAKAAKAEADKQNIEKLKSDYLVAMNDAKVQAEQGIEDLKSVKDRAERIADEKEANDMLEKAKAEWRANIRAALNKANAIKEAIPNVQSSVVVSAHTAVTVEMNNSPSYAPSCPADPDAAPGYTMWTDESSDPNHGNACFKPAGPFKGGGDWQCPRGCTKVHRVPWCGEDSDDTAPCRVAEHVKVSDISLSDFNVTTHVNRTHVDLNSTNSTSLAVADDIQNNAPKTNPIPDNSIPGAGYVPARV